MARTDARRTGPDGAGRRTGREAARTTTSGSSSVWSRLYHGETEIPFIERWKTWFAVSGAVILIGLVALFARGLNLGIDFTGGNVWQLPANGRTVPQARGTMEGLGFTDLKIQTVGGDLRVQTAPLKGTDAQKEAKGRDVVSALTKLTGANERDVVVNQVGPSWGKQISGKAVRALVVFLIVISLYITLRFEFKMAVATLAALFHDLLVVIGVYAILQLPVTPATVIAILTILGFSIYDGIVVFDRVDENTRLLSGSGKMTYSDMVDLSLNEVLMRSLNTQITALLPIAAVLVIGALVLGASTLEEFGLALFVGQLSGAYSSIFVASPVLALLKERESRYKALRRRLEERGERTSRKSRSQLEDDLVAADGSGDTAVVAEPAALGAAAASGRSGARGAGGAGGATRATGAKKAAAGARTPSAIPPRPRKKGKRR
ncbi:MAG: protein translocase subunit SecF [Actinobacteria bacterium]|nr:protein translocase subunit SecF [Actinomycetota bacterium]